MLLLGILGCSFTAAAQPDANLIDSLKNALRKTKADTQKVKLWMELGNNVGYYNAKAALNYAQRSLDLSRKIGYKLGVARAHYLLANTYLDLGNYAKSKRHLDTAEKLFKGMKRIDMLGKIHNARGNWYYIQGKLWNATQEFAAAIEVFHQLNDTLLEIIPYQNLIAILGETKNHEQAIARSKGLLSIAQKFGDSLQMAYCHYYLINNYVALNQLDSAQTYIPALQTYNSRQPRLWPGRRCLQPHRFTPLQTGSISTGLVLLSKCVGKSFEGQVSGGPIPSCHWPNLPEARGFATSLFLFAAR